MSSVLDNKLAKEKCQKFTPSDVVQTMLNLAGYTHRLAGHPVLENSFGSGNILTAIVKRYIDSCIAEGMDRDAISKGLSNDVYGIELDSILFASCKEKLNAIVTSYNLPPVDWHLYNCDSLFWDNSSIQFDYIIGNPPYIVYKEIDKDNQSLLREKFSSCSVGKFDYCYAFIEAAINMLSDNGKLVQLIPSNIYKNVYGKNLRTLLKDHIAVIYDYPSQNLFESTLTSSSIFLYDRSCNSPVVRYQNFTENLDIQFLRSSLADKWMFSASVTAAPQSVKFGQIFHASIAVATQLNEAFVISETVLSENALEKEIIRPAISPRSIRYKRKEFIIFPYKYINGELVRIPAEKFELFFPNVSSYLKKNLSKLNKRKKDSSAAWFEYGRSQALKHLNQEKLLLSTIVTNRVETRQLDSETIPYSGIYITVKDSRYSLKDAERILKSKAFFEYVTKVGIRINGKSIRITCKDINNFNIVWGE